LTPNPLRLLISNKTERNRVDILKALVERRFLVSTLIVCEGDTRQRGSGFGVLEKVSKFFA
jgi:hypothetical protein